uniref:SusC/RagA family TonB-linked outer membrane protein n=2 Tax=unclassified Prevotella TaxID=2638335 RepID=A0AB33JU58_9BACT
MRKNEKAFWLSLRASLTVFMMFFAFTLMAQNVTVKGSVKDQNGEPVIGATVKVAGAKTGVITNMDGEYMISVPKNATLEINYIGYNSKTVAVDGKSQVNIVLNESSTELNEIVVTALGIKKDAKKVGYAISTVKSDELIKTQSPTLGTALYGKAAGVDIKTAPGGAAGAISINVRGLSSITGTNQPLVVLDGVPIRNGEANNSDYWTDQRVNSNGLADLNPEDIESISILKGAAATAQYGSEGANGVVMVTTKNGKGGKGVGVTFNASVTGNFVAYMPEYQTTYGPGAAPQSRISSGADAYGFYTRNGSGRNGLTKNEYKYVSGTSYWGPKYDGSDVLYYDGTVRKFNPISSNPYSNLFRTGVDQQYNVAVTNSSDKGNLRFSYTYLNSLPNQYNSTFDRHNFALNGTQNILSNLKVDYSVNYMIENVKNRPYRMYRLLCNFAGMFGAFDDINYIRNSAITPSGYMNRTWNDNQQYEADVNSGYEYGFSSKSGLVDEYLWNIYGKTQEERNNRLIAKVAPTWDIMPGLSLRASLATDYTTNKRENKNSSDKALGFGTSGDYSLNQYRYTIIYGDAMLTYDKNLTNKLNLSAYLGWSGRRETLWDQTSATNGGLSVINWFNLNASSSKANTNVRELRMLKTAAFGGLTLSYDNWAYLEGTLRNEKISTLYKGNNSFWYPSVNASILVSELLKEQKPAWMDYTKVRASYGIVGLAPEIYKATIAYNQQQASGYIYAMQPNDLGNNEIKPERTYEWEFGVEGRFLQNRLGVDLAYYTKTVKDQILSTTTAWSSGANSILMNVGEFQNHGFEMALTGTPIRNKDWNLDLRFNIAFNRNKVNKLAEGVSRLEHKNWDNGAAYLYSEVGGSIGDIYAYAPKTDDKGNTIIDSDGYIALTDAPVKVGNVMPKYTGGFGFNLSYKNVYLDMSLDFRKGGSVLNLPYQYLMGRGSLVDSNKWRDAANGGQTYYLDNDNNVVPATSAPAGKVLYDDGVIFDGVTEDGKPNTKMASAQRWYNWSYNWGTGAPTYYSHSIFDNTYVKVREIVIGYKFPKAICDKIHATKLSVSAYARNPFYIYKRMPIFDAEATDATSWIEQSWIGGSSVTTRSFGVSLQVGF